MGTQKESIKINKENDNLYVIIYTVTERVNAKELVTHFDTIKDAHEKAKMQLEDAPKQAEARQKYFEAQLNTFNTRMDAFSKHAESANNYMKKEAEKNATAGKGDEIKDKAAKATGAGFKPEQPGKADAKMVPPG
jgi:predicted RNA-binding protein with RPS1 domain